MYLTYSKKVKNKQTKKNVLPNLPSKFIYRLIYPSSKVTVYTSDYFVFFHCWCVFTSFIKGSEVSAS